MFLLTVAITLLCAIFLVQQNLRHKSLSHVPDASCVSTGAALLMPLPPLEDLVHETPVIVTGDMKEKTQYGRRFEVFERIKGEGLVRGDIIDVCANPGKAPENFSYDSSALLFLKGMDKKKQVWVPSQFEMGILPHNNEGVYKMIPGDEVFTLREVRHALGDAL